MDVYIRYMIIESLRHTKSGWGE